MDAEALQDAALRTRSVGTQPSMGSAFESATWHGSRRFLKEHLYPSLRSATPPTEAALQAIADRYRAMAPEMVGPMPYAIEMFIAQYGSQPSSAPSGACGGHDVAAPHESVARRSR